MQMKDYNKPGGIMPIGPGIPIIGPTGPGIGAIGAPGIIPGGPPSKLPCGLAPGGRWTGGTAPEMCIRKIVYCP